MRRFGYGLFALAGGIAATALLGPLVSGAIRYHVTDDVLNQVMGGDLVSLVLIAPVCVAAGVLAVRGNPAAPVVAIGPAAFAAYTSAQLALGGEFAALPGNSERFFPMFLGVFVLAGALVVAAWRLSDGVAAPALRRTLIAVLFAVAAFLTLGLHLPTLLDAMSGTPQSIEYVQSPTVFWVVKLMDLGIVVPVAVATAIALMRRAPWAGRAAYAVIAWGAMLGSAVAGMALVMVVNDDPAASPLMAMAFGVFAAAFLGLEVRLVRPLVSPRHQGPPADAAGVIPPPTFHVEMGVESHGRDPALR